MLIALARKVQNAECRVQSYKLMFIALARKVQNAECRMQS